MTFAEFLASIGFRNGLSFWGVVAFLMSIGIEIIPKIKWKPWSTLLGWLGRKLNSDTIAKVEALESKVDDLKRELSDHITNANEKALQDTRRDILDFCNACMNGRRHTQEQFKFMLKKCDTYEEHIEAKKLKNGEISAAIAEIRRLNTKYIQENSFLKGEEEINHESHN